MIFSPRRAQRAFVRCAAVVLALVSAIALLAPPAALSATAPKIVSVDITGNVRIPAATILGALEAKAGEDYNPKLVSDDLARLNAIGYFADVAAPLVRQRPDGIAITYRVVENPVISKIAFEGNTHVPSDTLLALMDTSVGQVFNTNTFKQDVLKINSYYDKIGFAGLPSHVRDLNLDAAGGVLTLKIQEGFTINKILIVGDPLLPPTVILPVLNVKPGQQYSDELRDKDADAIKKLYDKYDLNVGNFEGGLDATTLDLKNFTADVRYKIDVMRVGAVQITGNTRTKDAVVRRQLRLLPGDVVTNGALKRDYDRLNNTGYFSKIDLQPKAGPDPIKHPELVTLDWAVTEQKTAQAQVGFGYSGGINGEGLYGTLGYSDNNLHGTGNGLSLQLQEGARNSTTQLQLTVPYLGNTEKSQKYSFQGTIFSSNTTYFYPVYQVSSGTTVIPSVGGTPAPIPVTLYQNGGTTSPIGGIDATSITRSAGVTAQVGRRLSDYTQVTAAVSAQRIRSSTDVPSPYFFSGGQPNVLVGPTPSPIGSNLNTNGSFGITATSIANTNTGLPYSLNFFTVGANTNTLDDYLNPSRGHNISLNYTVSSPSFGSSFQYTQPVLNMTEFLPFRRTGGTIGFHGLIEATTGAIPPSSLYTFSDQQLRGYNTITYATDALFGQIEFRQPVTPDRRLIAAIFVDQLRYRIYGAVPIIDPFTNRVIAYPGNWANLGDYGVGIRFDVPQLGLHTVRIDFGRGKNGTHTSFGIGQSF
jgi:outer membrane protein assembly factor BamA